MDKYVVIVLYRDGNKGEPKEFLDIREGVSCINNYRKCDNKKYKYVALLNKATSIVVRILCFSEGKLINEIYDGDVVRLRERYCEPGEAKNLYTVTDINENTGRCLIISLNSGMAIAPSETVGLEMIETVSHIAPLK